MIIDFRYHMASLIAVFLALGLGILIGSTIIGGDFSESMILEQGQWIERLERDYLVVRDDMNKLKLQVKNKDEEILLYQQFLVDISPHLIKDKLKGTRFVTLELYDSEYSNLIQEILAQAGANVTDKINLKLDNQKLNTFNVSNQLTYMERYFNYEDPINNIDGVIFIASPSLDNSLINKVQVPIIQLLKNQFPLWVVDNNSSCNSIKDISVINDIDTLQGQISFILTLEENLKNKLTNSQNSALNAH